MKFLLFNVVVSLALAFLLLGSRSLPLADRIADSFEASPPKTAVAEEKPSTQALTAPTRVDGGLRPALPATPALPKQARNDRPMQATLQGAKQSQGNPKRDSPAPATVVTEVSKPLRKPNKPATPKLLQTALKVADPAVARRRAEVLGAGSLGTAALEDLASSTAATPPTATAKFMTPEDRRRELHALAEAMESFFFAKLAR